MNMEIGAEAALFPEKEYINGFAVAVYGRNRYSASASCHACTVHRTCYLFVLCDEQEWPQERPEWSEFGTSSEDHQDKMKVQEDVTVVVSF